MKIQEINQDAAKVKPFRKFGRNVLTKIGSTLSEYDVINAVSKITGLNSNQLKMKTRLRPIVENRQIAMYLIQKYTNKSLARIGMIFDKDHATVIHAIKTVESLCDSDVGFKSRVNAIEKLVINML